MTTESVFNVTIPTTIDWGIIKDLIKEYRLDDNNLSIDQFIIVKNEQTLLGFGRLKKHLDCDEVSSLGVLPQNRNKGVGKIIIEELVKQAAKNIYIVTIIPDYFVKLGFEKTCQFPASMMTKQNDCKDVCGCDSPTVMMLKK